MVLLYPALVSTVNLPENLFRAKGRVIVFNICPLSLDPADLLLNFLQKLFFILYIIIFCLQKRFFHETIFQSRRKYVFCRITIGRFQYLKKQRMKCPKAHSKTSASSTLFKPLSHLQGGCFRKCYHQDLCGIHSLFFDQIFHPVSDHRSFSRPRTGEDHHGTIAVFHCFFLFLTELHSVILFPFGFSEEIHPFQ